MSIRDEFEAWWTLHRSMMSIMHGSELGEREKQFAFLVWQQSRAALMVELPEEQPGYMYFAPDVVESLEAAGIQVKP
jgi:hypothetical protein